MISKVQENSRFGPISPPFFLEHISFFISLWKNCHIPVSEDISFQSKPKIEIDEVGVACLPCIYAFLTAWNDYVFLQVRESEMWFFASLPKNRNFEGDGETFKIWNVKSQSFGTKITYPNLYIFSKYVKNFRIWFLYEKV